MIKMQSKKFDSITILQEFTKKNNREKQIYLISF